MTKSSIPGFEKGNKRFTDADSGQSDGHGCLKCKEKVEGFNPIWYNNTGNQAKAPVGGSMTISERKKLIEKAVLAAKKSSFTGESNSIPVSEGKRWAELKPKQQSAIRKNLQVDLNEENTVLFFDTTVFNSGKSGIFFGLDGIASDSFLNGCPISMK